MENKKYFLLEFDHVKIDKIKKNIIIKNYPADYLTDKVHKYYIKKAKYDYKSINKFDINKFDFIELSSKKIWMLFKSRKINLLEPIPILINLIFEKEYINKVKSFLITDLSYTPDEFTWVDKNLKNYVDLFKNIFKNNLINTTIKYNPRYDICDKYLKTYEFSNLFFKKIS